MWTACQWISNILLTPLLNASAGLTTGIRGYVAAGVTAWEIIYFCMTAANIALGTGPSPQAAVRKCLIVALLGWLIVSADAYNTYVQAVLLNDLPNDLMNAITGAALNAAAFDKLMEKAFTAGVVVLQNLPISFMSIPIGFVVTCIYWPVSLAVIFAGFGIWLVAKAMAAIAITLGPLMLAFLMFNALRGIAERWVSVLISAALVQFFSVAITATIVTVEGALVTLFSGANGDNIYNRAGGLLIAVMVLLCIGYVLKQIPQLALAIAGGVHFHIDGIAGGTVGRTTGAMKNVAAAAATGGKSVAVAAIRNRVSGPPGPSLSRSNTP